MFGIVLGVLVLGGTAFGMIRDYKEHKKIHAVFKDMDGFKIVDVKEKRNGTTIAEYEDGCKIEINGDILTANSKGTQR